LVSEKKKPSEHACGKRSTEREKISPGGSGRSLLNLTSQKGKKGKFFLRDKGKKEAGFGELKDLRCMGTAGVPKKKTPQPTFPI